MAVSGRLKSRSWTTPEGSPRIRYHVVADEVQFLARPSGVNEALVERHFPGAEEADDEAF